MGVKKLWTILEPTGQLAKLSDLRGYRVAIDLSYWIVEMSQITNIHGEKMPWLKPHIRNLFWRCYHLLRNQVRPVFVIDGMSPAVKGKTIEKRKVAVGSRSPSPERKGRGDCGRIDECKELLDCLGVPYIVSSGEAEALCAKLDREGLVDGCVTNDCDVFLYGANTVYRNFTCNKQKTGEMRVYHGAYIEDNLGLNREKLVAMALLIGSDYTDGAKNIGPETAIKLLGKDGTLSNTNVLERMRSWRADPEGRFAALEQLQTLGKPAHCSKCNHQGGVILHKAKGCTKCGTKKACKENFGECDCEYHNKQQEVSSNALELRVRRWAIEDPDFPSEQVIEEYLKPECDPVEDFQKVEWIRPDFSKLRRYLEQVLKFSKSDARQKTNELLVSWGMTHSKAKHQKDPLKCVRVMKARVQNSVPVLEVLWEDQGLGDLDLVTVEERETMVKHFPRAVERFDEETDKRGQSKKKTNKFNKVCKRIADLFKSKKKLTFPKEESSSASDSTNTSRNGVRPISFKSSVTPNSSKCTYSHPSDSPPLPDADSLVDAPPADFSEFLCAKLPDSSPEKSPNKVESTEADRFSILKRRGRKRKSYCLDNAREAKKLKLSDVPGGLVQPGVADIFKLKSDGAIASIPASTAPVSTRSRACSSDFTDGASTCSDLISDDDNETDVPVPSTSTTSNVTNFSSAQTTSAKSAPQTVVPSLRRSPRESVRQKALQYYSVTPSKGSRKRLRFSDGDKQPKINDFMRSTKSSRLSGIRL